MPSARGLLQLQPDIIIAKLKRSAIPAGIANISPDHTLSCVDNDTVALVNDYMAAKVPAHSPLWGTTNIFGRFRHLRQRYSRRKGRHVGIGGHKVEEFLAEYWTPSWLMNRIWSIRATKAASGWKIWLQSQIVKPRYSLELNYARGNNVSGLQKLFNQGKASPFDCDEYGNPILSVSSDERRDVF